MDDQLRELLVQTVTIAPWTGNSFDGQPTFGTDVAYAARIVGKVMQMRNTFVMQVGANEESVPTFVIYIHADNDTRISSRDRVTVPEQYRPDGQATVMIYTVNWIPDQNGTYYVKIGCGWMYHRQGSF
jgi:hypothetical protein